MKKFLYILLAFRLTTSCSFLPNSYPTETDIVLSILKTKDSITFPKKYTLLEDASEFIKEANGRRYNGCFQLSHEDIIEFIRVNKLETARQTQVVFQVNPPDLLKKEQKRDTTMPERWFKNQLEIYADTIQDKIYISKFY